MDYKDKRRRWQNKTLAQSFQYAIEGIITTFKEERNTKVHMIAACIVVIGGLLCHLHWNEWLWLVVAITLVVTAEMLNTAIENVVDLAAQFQYHPIAKKAKDIAAGAVLMVSIAAVIIGVIVFGHHFLK